LTTPTKPPTHSVTQPTDTINHTTTIGGLREIYWNQTEF
jgi:hypothetical protein